jgi:hypothetical protein
MLTPFDHAVIALAHSRSLPSEEVCRLVDVKLNGRDPNSTGLMKLLEEVRADLSLATLLWINGYVLKFGDQHYGLDGSTFHLNVDDKPAKLNVLGEYPDLESALKDALCEVNAG